MDEKPVSRRSIFAVWHWPRWVWPVLIGAAILYPFAMMPAIYFMLRCGVPEETIIFVTRVFFWPVAQARNTVWWVYVPLQWEFELLERVFGQL